MIDRYFRLAASPELEEYFAQFAPDATVEDEGREHHGIAEIRQWRTEVPAVTYRVLAAENTTGVVDAEISGDFPGSPVTLHFHFEFDDSGLISVLRIRP